VLNPLLVPNIMNFPTVLDEARDEEKGGGVRGAGRGESGVNAPPTVGVGGGHPMARSMGPKP